MTNEELDRVIAEKVMGFKVYRHPSGKAAAYERPEGLMLITPSDWSPTTTWAAAGEVIERMRELGWKGLIQGHGPGAGTYVRFHRRPNGLWEDGDNEDINPLRAICAAAALALGAVEQGAV